MPAVVEVGACNGCKSCEEVCPSEGVAVGDAGHAIVNREKCIDCAACVDACVHGAMAME